MLLTCLVMHLSTYFQLNDYLIGIISEVLKFITALEPIVIT